MWTAGSRPLGVPGQRSQANPLSAQTNQQDDIFTTSARMSSGQGTFRFGSQNSARQSSLNPVSGADEFPPLSRAANGEMGQERTAGLINSLGFGSEPVASTSSVQSSRAGNGLMNALNANARATETRSSISGTLPESSLLSSTADSLQAQGPRILEILSMMRFAESRQVSGKTVSASLQPRKAPSSRAGIR